MTRAFPVLDVISGWRLAPDTPPPIAAYPQEVLAMTLVDEITGRAPQAPLTASTTTEGLLARVDADGLAGLAGVPLTRFLATSVVNAALQLTVEGPGYLPLSVTANLGPQPGFPNAFFPADLNTVPLHRAPIVIAGRVVDASQAPLNSALVTVNGIWPTLASLQNAVPAAPNLIAVLSPLYADRDATATVAVQNLAPAAAAKTLLFQGNVGDMKLRLSDQVGLAAGSIIGLDQQDPGRGEYVTVASITDAGATPQQPATAILPFPLARPHAMAAAAIPMTPAAAGAANALARATQAGDATLFPATMTGLDGAMTAVVIAGGGVASAEYHAASLYAAATDTNGHMALPAINRLAQLQLRVHSAAQPTDLMSTVVLPFGVAAITLNLAFP
jgi:hypothetical protein